MSFSKAVFLTSLTCFTLGMGSGFAGCPCPDTSGSPCTTCVTCNAGTGGSNCDGFCSLDSAIQYVNANGGDVTFCSPYNTNKVSGDPATFTASTNIISSNNEKTTLGSSGDIRLFHLNEEGIIVTLGPSGSGLFVFDTNGYIQVTQGTFVFGPQVTYPLTSSALATIEASGNDATYENAFIELQMTGTIGSQMKVSPGTLYISTNPVDNTPAEVTFDYKLFFQNNSKLKGDGIDSKCISTITNSADFKIDNTLYMEDVTLEINSTNGGGGTIAMEGNAVLKAGTDVTFDSNTSITLENNGNTISAAPGAKFKIEGAVTGTSTTESASLTIGDSESTGTVVLSNTGQNSKCNDPGNCFTDLTINGGTFQVGSASQINGGSAYTLLVNPGTTLDLKNTMSFSNRLTIGGTSSTEEGNITLESGITVTVTNGLYGGDVEDPTSNPANLKITSPSSPGELNLEGVFSEYAGTVTLDNSTFNLNRSGGTFSIANFDLTNGSSLTLGNSANIGSISGGSTSNINLNSHTLTTTLIGDTTISGAISGTGNVVFQGEGIVTLEAASTYSGKTTIGSGVTLVLPTGAILGTSASTLQNGAALTLSSSSNLGGKVTLEDGGILNFASDLTLSPDINLESGVGTISLSEGVNGTLSGGMSGGGSLYVQGAGSVRGILTLSPSSSTYSGGTTIDTVILRVSDVGFLGSSNALTIIEGTLSATGSFTLTDGIEIGSGGGSLSIGSPNTLTVSGVITGSDSLTLAGSGIVILSGSNEYEGGTVHRASELQISSDANLGASSGSLTLSGSLSPKLTITDTLSMTRDLSIEAPGVTFNISSGVTASLTGDVLLAGTPSVTKSGDGILSILPSIVSSSPSINLIVNKGGVISNTLLLNGSSVDLTEAGTTLTFSQGSSGSYKGSDGGTITGVGGVIIDVTGTISMLIPDSTRDQLVNTYTGPTTLISGTLAISADGALGESSSTLIGRGGSLQTVLVSGESVSQITSTRPVFLTSDTNTTFNTEKGTVLALGGGITGSGNLIKSGKGILVLAEQDSTFTGTTSVNEGILVIDDTTNGSSDITVTGPGVLTGTAAEIAATISAASTIRGSGSGIIKSAAVHGNIAGGNETGDTLEVQGTLGIQKGAALLSKFNSQGINSSIKVGGPTTIEEGAVLFLVPETGTYSDSLTFIVLEGTTSGTIERGYAPPISFMKVEPSHGSVSVTVTPLTISLTGAGNNADAVASTLNDVVTWNRANVDLSIPGLDESGAGKLEFVLSSLLPIFDTSSMNDALDQMHPASLKNLVISQENASVQVQESLSTRLNEEMETLDCARTRQAYTFWINGMGSATNQDNNTFKGSPQIGYNNTMAGFIAGADYRFIDLLYVGALGGFTSSHVSFTKDRGAGDINTGYFGLYASAIGEGFFANVSITGGWNGYQANRRIQYQDVDLTAKNSHGGRQLMSHLEGGLNLPVGKFNLRPFDRFDYLSQQEYGYKEKDAGDWNLSVNKNTSILIRNELGLQFASCFQVSTGKITVSPKASWVREVRTRGSKYTASFTDAEDFTFSVTGYFPNRSLFSTGGVITGALLEDKLSLSAYYDGEFASGYSAHRYGGEVRYSF